MRISWEGPEVGIFQGPGILVGLVFLIAWPLRGSCLHDVADTESCSVFVLLEAIVREVEIPLCRSGCIGTVVSVVGAVR